MYRKTIVKWTLVIGMAGLAFAVGVQTGPTTTKAEIKSPESITGTSKDGGELLPATVNITADGALVFSSRGDDGKLTERMRLTKDGALAVGTRLPPGYPRGGTPGNMNVIIDDPSRPGTIIMFNEHKAAQGVGNTLCWYGSGEGQVFLSSSYLGEVRRVKQTHNRKLPGGYLSTDYPGPTSAARFEIGIRVHDWVSLAAIFEPIADDGHAFRENMYKYDVKADEDPVEHLPPGGEWYNNRRIGRHAFMVGTTHTTGATAGGVVLAGDSYHEYKGKGPVIKSPNGTAYRIVVDDKGNLSTEKF